MIELIDIKKIYGKSESSVNALAGINLRINDGEMTAIIGPSGSGKSTLLNIIGCLDKQTSGEYILNGKDISRISSSEMSRLRNSTFGFIVQDFALINEYTVYQNVILPIWYNKAKNDKSSSLSDCIMRYLYGFIIQSVKDYVFMVK